MKLLITTQCVDVNDSALGFFVSWIKEFAANAESVTVFALRVGEHNLPDNVTVLPIRLPGQGKIMTALRFMWLCIKYRKSYDAVFVHMNPEYLVLSGVLWRALGKRTALWYMHKSITWSLRTAVVLSHAILTASKESFPIKSSKVRVMGHGIEIPIFSPTQSRTSDNVSFVSIGRVSESKGYDVMLNALTSLEVGVLAIYGEPVNQTDVLHKEALADAIQENNLSSRVTFAGPIKHSSVGKALNGHTLFFHASRGTGSLDKAPLEAMLYGIPVVSTSPAFKGMLEPYGLYVAGGAEEFAHVVERYLHKTESDKKSISLELSAMVKRQHSLMQLIPRIMRALPQRISCRTHAKNVLAWNLLGLRNFLNWFIPLEEVGVLCYHSISDSVVETAVNPRQLEHHLQMVKSKGYNIVPLLDVVSWSRGEKKIPKKSLAITFDDGYEDFKSAALPILKRNNVPATLFVVGDMEGSRAKLKNDLPLLSQEAIKGLLNEPLIEVGFHAMTHADVRTLSGLLLEQEMRPPFSMDYFAYPGGNYSTESIETAKRLGYVAAFSIKPTQIKKGNNIYVLPRVVITRTMPDWRILFGASRAIRWYRSLWSLSTSV